MIYIMLLDFLLDFKLLFAFQEVLNVIGEKVGEQNYDDILEIAWSTLWNVTGSEDGME